MKLNGYKIILASNSPRRKELLSGLDIEYETRVIPDVDESYPNSLSLEMVAAYLAEKKASAYQKEFVALLPTPLQWQVYLESYSLAKQLYLK